MCNADCIPAIDRGTADRGNGKSLETGKTWKNLESALFSHYVDSVLTQSTLLLL